MRINRGDKFWVVVDARPVSELADILFETTLEGLERQFKGGLTCDDNPTIFMDAAEAEGQARARLVIAKAVRAMRQAPDIWPLKNARFIQIQDGNGATLFKAEL